MLPTMDATTAAEPLQAEQVQSLKHLKHLLPLFQRLHEVGCERDTAHSRKLHFDGYCALVMLYLFNPLIRALRTLQQAVALPKVAKALGVSHFSLGAFSEAPAVFDPQQLLPIIRELGGQVQPLGQDPRLQQLKEIMTAVDGTVLAALPRLAQAASCGTQYSMARDGKARYGWRLHTQLDLRTLVPHRIDVTGAGNRGPMRENNVLRANLEAGRCYVNDGGYADTKLFDDIVDAQSSYVCRIREDSRLEVVEERLLSEQDLAANVVRDAVVQLGAANAPAMKYPVRLVVVQVQPHPRRTRKTRQGVVSGTRYSEVLTLATNMLDLPAELVALIYQYRYTVELFFRFFKHLLGMNHLLSQREEGVQIQTYCALIACLVISLQIGRRPDKRTVEMMGWYLLGLASEQDVLDHLNKPDRRGVKLAAKEELWKKLGY
jgi:hypothetical protein